MIYQTQNYKLVTVERCISIISYTLPQDTKLHYSIYSKSDYNHSNKITEGDILSNQTGTDCISSDGTYVIHIQLLPLTDTCYISNNDSLGYYYDFSVYETYRNQYVTLAIEDICACTNCKDTKLSNCDNCAETDDLKNEFNNFIFQIFYNLYYSNIVNTKGFFNYIKQIIDLYNIAISNRFDKMISYGDIRGVFELDNKNKYILITAMYIFQYYKEIQETDNVNQIDIDYALNGIKACLFNNGLVYSDFEKALFDNNYFGKLFTVTYDCQGETDCTKVLESINNYENSFNKLDITTKGVEITTTSSLDRLVVSIPKVWKMPTEIRDESNTDILSEFNVLDLEGYYVFISKEIFTKGIYTIKLKYYE